MAVLTRRSFLAGAAAAAAALGTPAFAQSPKRGGTLRFIPIADLKVLDPIWTTAYVTRDHAYMIYDTLFATDANYQVRPQMVDKYTVSANHMKYSFTLRDGLKFHDGQPVTAEDCVASVNRWGKKDALGKLLMASTAKLATVDRKTFVLELSDPSAPCSRRWASRRATCRFIMPARLAATDPNEQVKEPSVPDPTSRPRGMAARQPGRLSPQRRLACRATRTRAVRPAASACPSIA